VAAPGSRRGLILGLVFGGGALFLVLGIVLAVIAFRSGRTTPAGGAEGDQAADGSDDVAAAAPAALKKKGPPPPLIVLTAEEQKKVDAATAKGVEFLKRTQ